MGNWAFRLLIIVGILVGLWHMRLALGAIFVFRIDEPLASWLAVVLGPGLTLLSVLVAAAKPKLGGALLIVAGIIAFAIFIVTSAVPDAVAGYFQMITLPCILLGTGILILARSRDTPAPHAP